MLKRIDRLILSIVLILSIAAVSLAQEHPIRDENNLPGTTAWHIHSYANNHQIEGYAGLASAPRGASIDLHIGTAGAYTLTVYRMGYYQNLGANLKFGPITLFGHKQPAPPMVFQTGLLEARWPASYWLQLDPAWISGFYLVQLKQLSTGRQAYIPFTIREDSRPSQILFVSATPTYQAYNATFGKSLYCFNSDGRRVGATIVGRCNGGIEAVEVSFDRPYDRAGGAGDFTRWEQPLLSYLESQGFDITYTTPDNLTLDKLLDLNGNPIHHAILSTGHDEYVSKGTRDSLTAMRDAGVGLGFLGGNPMGWQIRWAPDSRGVPNRTIIAYKVDWQHDPLNKPATENLVTGHWGQLRGFGFKSPAIGSLIGVDCNHTGVAGDIVIIDANNFLFSGTGLVNGDHLRGLLGFEANAVCNGTSPANTTILADSPDRNSSFRSNMTLYQAASGAWVFAAGSMDFSLGLSSITDLPPAPVDLRAQKFANNIMAALIHG